MSLSDQMLFWACQLTGIYPFKKKPHFDKNVVTSAAISQAFVEQTPINYISRLPFFDRYELIHHIQQGVLQTHPAPEDKPHQPIDERKVADKIRAIAKVSDTLRLSDNYTDFIMHVSHNAARNLTNSTAEVRRLMEWSERGNSERIDFCRDMHTRFMGHLLNGFKFIPAHEAFIQAANPVPIHAFNTEPAMSPNGQYITCPAGFAVTAPLQSPEVAYILVNTHPNGMIRTPEDAIDLIAHESAHIAEGIFASICHHRPEIVPEEFKWDAQLLRAMHTKNGYISSRLPSIYQGQASEYAANAAGEIARDVMKERLNEVTNTYCVTPQQTAAMNFKPIPPAPL